VVEQLWLHASGRRPSARPCSSGRSRPKAGSTRRRPSLVSLAGQRSFIPSQSILDTIGSGARVADLQGVAGQFMYCSAASFNGSQGTLEVLVHEASGQIRHVLFRSGVAP
jgi:hypothetical protein